MSWKRKNDKAPAVAEVVEDVQEQTRQAIELASIAGQTRLMDPRLNPATRSHADRLRDGQHIKALDAEDARMRRVLRVSDARAAEAERTLEAIALAKRASDPARSVLALHTGRRVYARLSTVASVVLAAGSAMGVEEVATKVFHAPPGSGYIAEVGLTGLSTVAITYRAHLAEHRGDLDKGSWQSRSLWALMVVPLLVSVTANLVRANAIGAACAIGAASFAVMACVIADRSSAAMQKRADEVSDDAEKELRRTAMGDDLFTAVVADPETGPEPTADEDDEASVPPIQESNAPDRPVNSSELPGGRQDAPEEDFPVPVQDGEQLNPEDLTTVTDTVVAVELPEGLTALERFLADQDPPADGGSVSSAPPEPDDGSPHGAARSQPGEPPMRPGGHIDGDQPDRRTDAEGPAEGPERVLPAIQARRAAGASTRQRVAGYWTKHPDATIAEMVQALDLSETTVKRHRREIRAARTRRNQQAGGEQA